MYPDARIVAPMKIWKLPKGKEDMLSSLCESGEYFGQEKIDGYWYQYEKTQTNTYLFSRNISTTTGTYSEKGDNVPHIMEALSCLPPRTTLIGEIYYPGGTSKNVTTIMGCLPQKAIERQKDNLIHYYVHDIIQCDGVDLIPTQAAVRYKILSQLWKKYELDKIPFLRLAEYRTENLVEYISSILEAGGEGVVLKKKDLPYYPGERPAWSTIKVKQMDTIDLICTGFTSATVEYTGKELETWPYWVTTDCSSIEPLMDDTCHYGENGWMPVTKPYYYGWPGAIKIGALDDNGKIVDLGTVSSGLTDADRTEMAKHPESFLNKVVSLSCMSIDKKEHTLRHPVFKAWRDDKPAYDCVISEVFA